MLKNTSSKIIAVFVALVVLTVAFMAIKPISTNNTAPAAKDGSQNIINNSTGQPTNQIVINNFAFEPAALSIPAGTTVTWTNQDAVTHTVASTLFNSPELPNGATFEFKFTEKGTYDYHCSIHPSMKGSIVVQ